MEKYQGEILQSVDLDRSIHLIQPYYSDLAVNLLGELQGQLINSDKTEINRLQFLKSQDENGGITQSNQITKNQTLYVQLESNQ